MTTTRDEVQAVVDCVVDQNEHAVVCMGGRKLFCNHRTINVGLSGFRFIGQLRLTKQNLLSLSNEREIAAFQATFDLFLNAYKHLGQDTVHTADKRLNRGCEDSQVLFNKVIGPGDLGVGKWATTPTSTIMISLGECEGLDASEKPLQMGQKWWSYGPVGEMSESALPHGGALPRDHFGCPGVSIEWFSLLCPLSENSQE